MGWFPSRICSVALNRQFTDKGHFREKFTENLQQSLSIWLWTVLSLTAEVQSNKKHKEKDKDKDKDKDN